MQTIRLELAERSYDIQVGSGILSNAGALLDAAGLGRTPLFIVCDTSIASLQLAAIHAFERLPGRRTKVAVAPAGEESKSIQVFSHLLDQLASFEEGE
ncbi:MAG: 3-dehydroquinate synthase, partial [Chloroflexi bacterium]|nr:3-dehydroquinate synthase [Chloroflexota bacterium]